ncbi:pilus assembly protein [Pelomonas sp. APW6]|uniref:Pilus assembly protein n=1 Tax=Roseateles subflavus TaxID=3053353 RepID=A0ABT7LEQ0_9BURK|nr:TadE family protein [Pelomonas sp. APW6]MDL5031334.1 pilus assembly protein [Pelomonas sp. APW6]
MTPRHPRIAHRQRGQSTTEFLVALIAMVPIFLAVNYLGRYADMQQRATQASRYAAFQRALEPSTARLSDAVLADQTRARLFLAPKALNGGAIRSDDTVASAKDAKQLPAFWRDLGGEALLNNPSKVTVGWTTHDLNSKGMNTGLDKVTEFMGKDYAPGHRAQVELTLLNRLSQAEAKPADLKIGAATAAAGDMMGSGGTDETVATVSPLVPVRFIPSPVRTAVSLVVSLLEGSSHKPEFGCIKANVVASHRLEGDTQRDSCR